MAVAGLLASLADFAAIEQWWHTRTQRVEPLAEAANRSLAPSHSHPTVIVEVAQDGASSDDSAVLDVYLRNTGPAEVIFNQLSFPRDVAYPLSGASTAPAEDLPEVVYEISLPATEAEKKALSPPFRIQSGESRGFRVLVRAPDGSRLRAVPSFYLYDTNGEKVAVGILPFGLVKPGE